MAFCFPHGNLILRCESGAIWGGPDCALWLAKTRVLELYLAYLIDMYFSCCRCVQHIQLKG